MKRSQHIALLAVLGVGVVVAGAWVVHRCLHDPSVAVLPGLREAPWIVYPSSPRTNIHLVADLDTRFRRTFTLSEPPKSAMLEWRGFRRATVRVNDIDVATSQGNWKDVRSADVASQLRPGENTLEITVVNDRAAGALSARLTMPAQTVPTDSTWRASIAGSAWRDARRACEPVDYLQLTPDFPPPTAWQALLAGWRSLLVFAVLVTLAVVIHARFGKAIDQRSVTWAMIIAAVMWAALFMNNAPALGVVGNDARFHLDYIQYILDHSRLPTPDLGAEMFQPPLYYLVSAGLLKACGHAIIDDGALHTLRMAAMVLGAAQLMLIGIGLRLLMPGKFAWQLLGLVVAGFMPLHLYAFQYPSNELLAATLTTGVLVLGLHVLRRDEPHAGWLAALGVCLGAAVLSKATPIIAGVLVMAAIAAKASTQPRPWRVAGKRLALTGGAFLMTCGWYYFSIWQAHGRVMLTGYQLGGEHTWWGDPGYATAAHYTHFGRALIHPIYACFHSVPNGIYSTLFGDGLVGGRAALLGSVPWSMTLMLGGYVLALPVMAALLLGAALVLWRWVRKPDTHHFVVLAFPASVLAAMVYLSIGLQAPNYPQSRAIFAMGAMLPLCALAAYGFQAVACRHKRLRWFVVVLLGVWALNNYASYWVVRNSTDALAYRASRNIALPDRAIAVRQDLQTVLNNDPKHLLGRITAARLAWQHHRDDVAAALLTDVVNDYPQASSIHMRIAQLHEARGETDAAANRYQAAIKANPDNGYARDGYAALLMRQGRRVEAIESFRAALHSLNDNAAVHQNLAGAYTATNDHTRAAYHLRIAKRLEAARRTAGAAMGGG